MGGGQWAVSVGFDQSPLPGIDPQLEDAGDSPEPVGMLLARGDACGSCLAQGSSSGVKSGTT